MFNKSHISKDIRVAKIFMKAFEEIFVSSSTLAPPAYVDPFKQGGVNGPHEEQIHLEPTSYPELNRTSWRKDVYRVTKSTISSDYLVYLQEIDFDIGLEEDRRSFSKT